MSFHRYREVKTRKPHSCEWCGEIVEKGERAYYRAYTGPYGDFVWGWQHPECFLAMMFGDVSHFDEWMPGDFARGRDSEDADTEMVCGDGFFHTWEVEEL